MFSNATDVAELEKRGLVEIMKNGVVVIVDRSIHNSGVMKGNFNTGDHVVQSNVTGNENVDKAFTELFDVINKMSDDSQKAQAEFFAQQLQQATQAEDKSTAQKMLGFLTTSLGNISALVTIGQFLGMPVPPIPGV